LLTGTTANTLYYDSTTGNVTWGAAPTGAAYTNEEAQDAVGTILTDTSTINFTYDDALNTITADVILSAIPNIYNSNGTLTANRTLTGGGFSLEYTGLLWFNNKGAGANTTLIGKLAEATGDNNTVIGDNAGGTTDTDDSVYIGTSSGYNSIGSKNTFVGSQSGTNTNSLTLGRSTFIGYSAGDTSSGDNSVALGCDSGKENTGADCISIGNFSGFQNTGQKSIFLGGGTGTSNTYNNCFITGYNATATGDGQFVLPNISASYFIRIGTDNITADRTLQLPDADGDISLFKRIIELKSSNFTAGDTPQNDYVYFVSGTTTCTLPTAVGNKNEYKIKNVGANTVTIAASGAESIDGSSTVTITSNAALTIISDDSNWNVF
jgi:hypothetical protein